MKEQLQSALTELLGKANDGITTASEFLVSELPEVIQQLLMWHGITSAVSFAIGILIFMFSPKILKIIKGLIPPQPTKDNNAANWFYDRYYSSSSEVGIGGTLFYILAGFGIILLSIFATASINIQWLQIWIAPKVWLIEYAAKLAS